MDTITVEERVRQIRASLAGGDRPTAEDHFATLLQQSSPSTERWLRRVIATTPTLWNASAYPVCEDLRQELALYVWKRLADPTRHEMAWESMYWQSLIFAQQHVATRYMRASGYWVAKRAGLSVAEMVDVTDVCDRLEAPDMVAAAELTDDVRAVVMRLPPKERAAIVLRYWVGMKEREIGRALGCTDRTVRTLLTQARGRLGPWYEGSVRRSAGIE